MKKLPYSYYSAIFIEKQDVYKNIFKINNIRYIFDILKVFYYSN
jgi:hypothetical protein